MDLRPVGESLSAQTCSTSYCLKDAGEFEMPWSSIREKEETGLDLLLKTCKHVVTNKNGEMVKEGSISIEDRGYVSDSPTSGENPGGGRAGDDNQEFDSVGTEEDVSCKISKGTDIEAETKGDAIKHEENSTAEPKGEENVDHQKIESTGDDDRQKDSREISTHEVVALVGEDFQEVDTNNEVDGKHEDCQISYTHVTACDESLPAKNSKDIETNADENLLTKDGTQLKRDKPSSRIEVFYQKRRKVSQPDGDRRRTRRFSRDCPSS